MENSTTLKKSLWWEKTVEWQFVLSLCQKKNVQAAPLGGNPEAAESDARICFNGKFALVEFKREYGDCKGLSEKQKYARHIENPDNQDLEDSFQKALEELKNNETYPGHTSHFFVYGAELSVPAQSLELKAASYWDHQTIETDSIVETLNKSAVGQEEFKKYVGQLAKLRNYKESDESGGASVLGFKDGRIIVMDILDYARDNKLLTEKNIARKQSKKI